MLLTSVESLKEADLLIQDLFTPQEIEALSERWQIIRMLAKGIPQREISKILGISISTITRGSRVLQHDGKGFEYFLKKIGDMVGK